MDFLRFSVATEARSAMQKQLYMPIDIDKLNTKNFPEQKALTKQD
jgi:hypothetical protein